MPNNPKPCSRCGKPVSADYSPFCSKRCADIDLGAWLSESYVIASDEEQISDSDDAE